MSSELPLVVDGVYKHYKLATHNPFTRLARKLTRGKDAREDANDLWALHDISFAVDRGETLGVVGKNGAGKSTLLKVLCGVTSPTRGSYTVRGRVAPLIEVGAGFHGELSGKENVFLSAAIMGMPRKEVLTKYDAIVEFSGLEKFMDTPVKRYSSGMLARLGFSVAVHIDPDVLLVDEVLSVGDLGFVLKSYRKIEAIRKDGIPVLLVSHNLQLIRNFCTRAIWLEKGKLMADGTPKEVCAKYTKFVLENIDTSALEGESESFRVHSDPAVSITSVRCQDASGETPQSFETGTPFQVKVEISADRATGPLIVFVTVWQLETGQMLICHNNQDDDVTLRGLDAAGERSITMKLPRMPFINGLHQVSVSVAENTINNVCDWHEKLYSFRVAGGSVGYGQFHAFPEWEV